MGIKSNTYFDQFLLFDQIGFLGRDAAGALFRFESAGFAGNGGNVSPSVQIKNLLPLSHQLTWLRAENLKMYLFPEAAFAFLISP
jgi:hypothetical protein